MDKTEVSWRSQSFRQAVRGKIEEFFKEYGIPTTINASEMESHLSQLSNLFLAETKEDYVDLLSLLMYYLHQKYSKNAKAPSSLFTDTEQNVEVNVDDQVSDSIRTLQSIADQGSSPTVTVQSQLQTTTFLYDSTATIPAPLPQTHIQEKQDFDYRQVPCATEKNNDKKDMDEEYMECQEEVIKQDQIQVPTHGTLCCRSIKIGSYYVRRAVNSPVLTVSLQSDSISFEAPLFNDSNECASVRLEDTDIVKVFAHLERCLTVLFVFTTPAFVENVKEIFKIGDATPKLTFRIQTLSVEQDQFLHQLFSDNQKYVEIDTITAKSILLDSNPEFMLNKDFSYNGTAVLPRSHDTHLSNQNSMHNGTAIPSGSHDTQKPSNKNIRHNETAVTFRRHGTQNPSNQDYRQNGTVIPSGSHDTQNPSNKNSRLNETAVTSSSHGTQNPPNQDYRQNRTVIPSGSCDTKNANLQMSATLVRGQNPNPSGGLSAAHGKNPNPSRGLSAVHGQNPNSSGGLSGNKSEEISHFGEHNPQQPLREIHHNMCQYPLYPDVRFKDLPFHVVKDELMRPTTLLPITDNPVQERYLEFYLCHKRLLQKNLRIKLRICPLDLSCKQDDVLPSNFRLIVNNTELVLPESLPKPNLPIDISSLSQRFVSKPNVIWISWSTDSIKPYVLGVYLVQIRTRKRNKKSKKQTGTKAIIKELCLNRETGIPAMNFRASLICPLGKTIMELPCRATTCTHLQCFDATVYLKLNDKRKGFTCPICDEVMCSKKLKIDGLFMKIIRMARSRYTEVVFQEDGNWKPVHHVKENTFMNLRRIEENGMKPSNDTTTMIRKKLSQDQESGIAITSLRASLMCPLGKMRMKQPCRAATCTHLQCFDATVYLQIHKKKAERKCPICDKLIHSDLIIDSLFLDIIHKVPPECTEIDLYANGSWSPVVPVQNYIEINDECPMSPQFAPENSFSEDVNISKRAMEIENLDSDYVTGSAEDLSPPQKKMRKTPGNI